MNIAEILKGCPKGMKLYSTIFGEVELYEVRPDAEYPILIYTDRGLKAFSEEGNYLKDAGECALSQSKDNRNWDTFVAPSKKHTFQPFEKVLVRDTDDERWTAAFFSYYNTSLNATIKGWDYVTAGTCGGWRQCIPFEGNEHLVGTTDKPAN